MASPVLEFFLAVFCLGQLCFAAWPVFSHPDTITYGEAAPCRQAFTDAIILARHTALFHDDCAASTDPIFLRYFRANNAKFVGNMFRAIADIPFDEQLSTGRIQSLLAQPPSLSDKYATLSIFCPGDHPYLVQEYDADEDGCNSPRAPDAYTVVEGADGIRGYMALCPRLFMDPFLRDIESPPYWARNPATSKFAPGYGCDNLGSVDSSWMISTGATVLHELMHFEGLFRDVPAYIDTIPYSNGDNGIEDLGNGPWQSNQVNLRASSGENAATNNADSYVFYAVSKYYSIKCGRTFEACPNPAAAIPPRSPPPFPFRFAPPAAPPPA